MTSQPANTLSNRILNSGVLTRRPSRRKSAVRKSMNLEALETRALLTSLSPFESDAGLYQIYSNYGQTGEVNPADGTFQNTTARVGEKINAVGFRPADQFAYGILSASFELARVGNDGSHESLGLVDGLPTDQRTYFVGDFANDDLLWVRNGGQLDKLYGINVDTAAVEKTITTDAKMTNLYDIAFNPVDERFYASRRGPENTLTAISMDGKVTTIGQNGLQLLTFGAMYADAEGNVFGGANQTGGAYRFDTQTGAATWIAQGPASGTNDGFSNSTEVLELPPAALDDSFDSYTVKTVSGNIFENNGGGADVDGNDDIMRVVAIEGTSNVGRAVTLDSGATVTLSKDGTFEYDSLGEFDTLAAGQTATDSFTYTIADDTGREDTATATITLTGAGRELGFEGDWVRGLHHYGIRNKDVVLTNIGDVNGDGHDDAAVAATKTSDGAGMTFVVYGSEAGISSKFDVQNLFEANGGDGSQGAVFHGANRNDRAGQSVSPAGDINGDGIDDFIIGASDADPNGVRNAGTSYVVFGTTDGFDASVSLADIANSGGQEGFAINGIGAHDLSGSVVAAIGDINNDGRDDIAIGASQADIGNKKNAGQTYVLYGTDELFSSDFELSSLLSENGGDGSRGFVLNGTRKHDWAGTHVEGGADLNGDGLDDLLVTAPNANADRLTNSGQSYVIFGDSEGFAPELDLGDFRSANGNDGTHGFSISGSNRKSREGGYVRIADDMNSDGIADLVIGVGNQSSTRRSVLYGVRKCGGEIRLVSLMDTQVYLDNFDQGNADYDGRAWDQYIHSATLHSTEGTAVTIWGDPHVIITIDGVTERFDIGYGEGEIVIDENTTIRWASQAYDPDNPDQQLPLDWFSVDTTGSDLDITVDADDGVDVADRLTGLSDAQLREFASQLREFAGLATEPLRRK